MVAESKKKFPYLLALPGCDPENIKPPYGFEPANQAQFDYITAPEEHVFLWGNRGGGKSVTARWAFHALAMAYPGYRYGILRTSYPELNDNHLIYLDAEMKALGGDYHSTKHIARYPNGSLGFYRQAETDEQVRNALGVEMHGVCYDEAPTFDFKHLMMISASVRVPPESGLTPIKRYLGNPIGPCIDELFKYFVDKDVDPLEDRGYRPEKWRSIKIDLNDNPHLDVETYKQSLGVGMSEKLRKAWLDGEKFDDAQLFDLKPTVSVEVVNPETKATETEKRPYHVITELPKFLGKDGEPTCMLEQPWVRIYGGYDDGYVDPYVMLWVAVVGQQIICFNERWNTRLNSLDIAREIVKANVVLRADGTPYQLPLSTIYADPTIAKETTAVQSTQEVMESVWHCMVHGLGEKKRCCAKARGLSFEPSTNSRELYASAIHRLLQNEVGPNAPRVQFLKPDPNTAVGRDLMSRGITGCPYLLKSLPKMQSDEHNPQKMASHKHDHPVCAFAYYAMSYQTQTAPRVEVARPEWWSEFFVGNSNIPRKDVRGRQRSR